MGSVCKDNDIRAEISDVPVQVFQGKPDDVVTLPPCSSVPSLKPPDTAGDDEPIDTFEQFMARVPLRMQYRTLCLERLDRKKKRLCVRRRKPKKEVPEALWSERKRKREAAKKAEYEASKIRFQKKRERYRQLKDSAEQQ